MSTLRPRRGVEVFWTPPRILSTARDSGPPPGFTAGAVVGFNTPHGCVRLLAWVVVMCLLSHTGSLLRLIANHIATTSLQCMLEALPSLLAPPTPPPFVPSWPLLVAAQER